jgi:hypothetical protein
MTPDETLKSRVYHKYCVAFEAIADLKTPDTFCIMNIGDIHLTPENTDNRFENLLEFSVAGSLCFLQ